MLPQQQHRRLGHYFDLPARWCGVALGGLGFSALGAGFVLWAQARVPGLLEWLPLLALLGMAAVLYWFDCRLFNLTQPRPQDLAAPTTQPPKES